MGNLITELPVSEMNATIELLDRLGVDRDGLKRFRKASSHEQMTIAQMLQNGIIPAEQKFVSAPPKPIDHVLDLTTIPKLPFDGAEIVENKGAGVVRLERRGDDLYLDGKKIELHLSPKQKKGTIGGNDLRKYLEGKPVLNAAVLDYLLAHPELIPDSWKKNKEGNTLYTFFFGTIYRRADGNLYVRCLCWDVGRWVSRYRWLGSGWNVCNPSALLAS